jgi:hypothetical protein
MQSAIAMLEIVNFGLRRLREPQGCVAKVSEG